MCLGQWKTTQRLAQPEEQWKSLAKAAEGRRPISTSYLPARQVMWWVDKVHMLPALLLRTVSRHAMKCLLI